jgi:hypothetical protein
MIMIMKVQLVCLQRLTAVTVTTAYTAGAPTDRRCHTLQQSKDE